MTARAEGASRRRLAEPLDVAIRPPAPEEWTSYLATHGRSFSLASVLIPEPRRSQVTAVYAFCRFTDDLVDRHQRQRGAALAQLDYWLDASEAAYRGEGSEHAILQIAMRDMAEARVPFEYVSDLIRGMRMDVLG